MAADRMAQALDAAITAAEASQTKTTVVSAEFLRMLRGGIAPASALFHPSTTSGWLSESMAADAKRYGME